MYEVSVLPSMKKGDIVGHIVIDVNSQCHYVIMMSWYEQSVEESTYILGEVACKKFMYRRTNKVQGIKISGDLTNED